VDLRHFADAGTITYQVFDMQGKLMYEASHGATPRQVLSLHDLHNGSYQLRLTTGDGQRAVARFVKL